MNLKNIFYNFLIVFILISLPITNVYLANLGNYILLSETVSSYFFLVIIFIINFIIFKIIFKEDRIKIIFFSCCLFYYFFLFAFVTSAINNIFEFFLGKAIVGWDIVNLIGLFVWVISYVLLIVIINKLYSSYLRYYIYTTFVLVFLFNIIYIFNYYRNNDYIYEPDNNVFANTKVEEISFTKNKNIYLLVFDMYASNEFIEDYLVKYDYKIHNDINQYLENMDFVVTYDALSNYGYTHLSVPSILNSNYLHDDYFFSNEDTQYLYYYNDTNPSNVESILKKNNYKSNYIACGGEYFLKQKFCMNKRDMSILDNLDISFFNAVLYNTPLRRFISLIESFNNKIKKESIDEFDYFEITKNITMNKSNSFLYVHFLFPHPPYMYDKNCDFKEIASNDVSNWANLELNDDNRLNGYLDNFFCATKVIKKIVDQINQVDRDAIIIVASDHGPHLFLNNHINQKIKYEDILNIHSSILSIKVDESCKSKFEIEDLTHVNLFRIVMNCLSDDNYNSYLPHYIFFKDINFNKLRPQKIEFEKLISLKKPN